MAVAGASRADAGTITMNPNPVDVGNVDVGMTSAAAMGTLSDTANDHVDLVIGSCSGGGMGTFNITPKMNVSLKNPTMISVTYAPTMRGTRQCTVNVYNTGTTNSFGTFTVRGNGQDPPTISVQATAAFGAVRFNDAAPNHTATQSITVQNTGDRTLNITNVTITGGNAAGDYTRTMGGTSASIAPGNTATWQITFNPSSANSRTANLTFMSNDPANGSEVVALSGTGSTGVIGVNNLDFMIVGTGSSSSLDITVANNGAGTKGNLGVTSATIAGGGGWFTFSACGGGATCDFMPDLAIPNSAIVGITCSPPANANANDTQNATVTFSSDTDDAGGNPDRVSTLVCVAGKGSLATNLNNLPFANQLLATTSNVLTAMVTNTGNQPTTFYFQTTGANAGDFVPTTQSGCGAMANPCTMAAGQTINFDVAFTPSMEGDISAGLSLVSPSTPFPQLTLAGRGIDRHIAWPAAVMAEDTFRNPGDMPTIVAVPIDNIGEATLNVSSLAIDGSPTWTLVSGQPETFDLNANSTHTVMVAFAPPLAGKAPPGMLRVVSNDRNNGAVNIMLTGNGKDRQVQIGPTSIDIGDTGAGVPTRLSEVRPYLMQIANLDDVNTFRIREVKLEGDRVFEVIGLSPDAELAPAMAQDYDVVFTPPTVGDFNATLTLYLDQDPISQGSVAIHGRALFVDAHGSGGCSTSGNASGAMALVVVALVLARRRRGAVLAVLVMPAALRAEPTRNIDLTVFDPTPSTTSSTFQLQSADVGARGEFAGTAFVSYASSPLVLGTLAGEVEVVRARTMMSIGGAYAFLDRFEVGARMPFYSQKGDAVQVGTSEITPPSGSARGDLTLHAKARLVRSSQVSLGATVSLQLPTATDDEFAGAKKVSARALALASFGTRRLAVNINAGGVLRPSAQFANVDQRSGFAWGGGATLRIATPLSITAEAFGDMIPKGYHPEPPEGSTMAAPKTLVTLEWLAGIRYQVTRQISIAVAGGRGITSSAGTPDLRGVFVLAFNPTAKPLVPLERPRQVVMVPVGPPIDPTKLNSDNDLIPDAQDLCPKEAEDEDGFEDTDGCPELDNDHDGLADTADKCRNEPEDKDGFEDDDGCPELDNDKDGIADTVDKCPLEPETINNKQDTDGCPDAGDSLVVAMPDRVDMLEPVAFTGPNVAKKSLNVLSQLAGMLKGEEIVRVRITTHVQPTKNVRKDQQLSEKRAAAVRAFLIKKGVPKDKLETRGFGGTKPLVPATDKGAAAINDRLEVIILERK